LINDLPRYEILDEAALAEVERGWRRIVSELGIEFLHPEALEVFKGAGQSVEGELVRLDPDWILEQVAKAPPEFDLQARNPERTVHIGGNHMVFSAVYGCPFVREGIERRDATYDDFQNLVRLAQSFPQLDSPGGTICEPNDRPLDSRHLDMVYALLTLSDKPFMGSVTSGPNAVDTIAMAELVFGRESMMPLWPTFRAGTNFVMHSAGWLESALVSCYEKFVVDVEILRMLHAVFQPLRIDEETLAYSAHQEVGQGGHFLGAVHTLERF